ncbi:MAG: hypothetical protein HZB42_10740 [Sphingobacteriales bacterium]|nr:hypothetical protein [Sphingobacteriales bacterium]
MRSLFIILLSALTIVSCNQKDKQSSSKQKDKKNVNSSYVVSKDGIGEVKIGMTQAELEKLLNQKLAMKYAGDPEAWADTSTAKYKDIDVTLYFERYTNEDETHNMQLTGVKTSSSLCTTASGLGIGDDKPAIIAAYDDNPIDMGPEYEQVNDTTWAPSKIKYNINIKDDKWDRQLIFQLIDKKVASLGASIIMGE